MKRVNPQLLKMAMEKVAVIPPEAPPMGPADPAAAGGAPPMGGPPMGDPAAMGGAPPMGDPAAMGAMPPGAAPPMGAPPMGDPAAMGGAPPMAPAAPQKPKVDEVVAGMERRMQRMEKTMAQMAGAQGVTLSPEDLVEEPLTDEQGNATPESVSNPQSSAAQAEFDPAAGGGGGAPPAGGGAAPPPGGDIGAIGGLDAMGGPKMASALQYGDKRGHPSRIGSAVAKPSAGNVRDKAAALAGVMRRLNAAS